MTLKKLSTKNNRLVTREDKKRGRRLLSEEDGWVRDTVLDAQVRWVKEFTNSVGGISHSVVKGKFMCVERHWSRPLLLLLTSTASGFPISPQLAGETGCAPVSAAILGFANPKDLIFTPQNRHPTN